jgi:hypothetical protein
MKPGEAEQRTRGGRDVGRHGPAVLATFVANSVGIWRFRLSLRQSSRRRWASAEFRDRLAKLVRPPQVAAGHGFEP